MRKWHCVYFFVLHKHAKLQLPSGASVLLHGLMMCVYTQAGECKLSYLHNILVLSDSWSNVFSLLVCLCERFTGLSLNHPTGQPGTPDLDLFQWKTMHFTIQLLPYGARLWAPNTIVANKIYFYNAYCTLPKKLTAREVATFLKSSPFPWARMAD